MEKTLLCRYINKSTKKNYLISKKWFCHWENYMFLDQDSDKHIKKYLFDKVSRPSLISNQKAIETESKSKILQNNSKLVFNTDIYQ